MCVVGDGALLRQEMQPIVHVFMCVYVYMCVVGDGVQLRAGEKGGHIP